MLTSQLETWGQELSSIKHFRIGNLKKGNMYWRKR